MNIPKFVFIHIMKTAGTSFRYNVLERISSKYVYDSSYKNTKKITNQLALSKKSTLNFEFDRYPKNYQNADIIFGHFLIGKYEHLNLPFVTFVRDPVERVISQYFYLKPHYKDITIHEFAKIYPNHMSWVLGNSLDKLEFVGISEYYEDSLKKFGKHFGLNIPKYRKKYRVQVKKPEVSAKDREIIFKYNQDDIKLYNEALKLFR